MGNMQMFPVILGIAFVVTKKSSAIRQQVVEESLQQNLKQCSSFKNDEIQEKDHPCQIRLRGWGLQVGNSGEQSGKQVNQSFQQLVSCQTSCEKKTTKTKTPLIGMIQAGSYFAQRMGTKAPR